MVGACQTCGDIGFSNALIYCEMCVDACQHRYCAEEISFTEDVIWFCEDCQPTSAKQNSDNYPTSLPEHKSKGLRRKHNRRVKNLTRVTQIINQLTGDWMLNGKNNHEPYNGKDQSEIQKDSVPQRLMQENSCTVDESDQNKVLPDDLQKNSCTRDESLQTTVLIDDPQEDLCTRDVLVQNKFLPEDQQENVCTGDESVQTNILPDDLQENLGACVESFQIKILPDYPRENLCARDGFVHAKVLPEDPQENLCTGYEPVQAKVLPYVPHDNLDQCPIVFTQPIMEQVWRGQFHICGTTAFSKHFGVLGLAAHLSNKASWRVFQEASLLPTLLCLKMLPKSQVWRKEWEPSDNDIGLFFFSGNKVHEKAYDCLVDGMLSGDLAMKAVVQNAELLVFPSSDLPLAYWRFQRKLYLWGVFKNKEDSSDKDHVQ